MKVLQLCNKPPYPPVDGGTLAMNSITLGLLRAGCEVRVLTVETDKHPARTGEMPDDYRQRTQFESVYVDLGVKALPAAVAAFCGESYHVKRYINSAFAQRLTKILQEQTFDVVHIESIFLTPYVPIIRRHSQAKVILRAHNVEHLIWRRVAQSTHNPLKRSYLKHLSLTLRAYELEHVNDYDGVVCITQADANYFRHNGCRRPIAGIPFGVEVSPECGVRDAERNGASANSELRGEPCELVEQTPNPGFSLFHIGAMDWIPNQESIAWLLDEVWPVVHREVPQAHLYLAGRKMPERWMKARIDGVTVVGEVDDAAEFIRNKQINVVPLLSGSGIRVKIIEAMAAGKAVVTTTIGAQGIDYTDGVNLLLANTPVEFARQIKRCTDDPAYCHSVGEAAAQLIRERYNGQKLADELIEFYNKRLEK